MNNSEGFVPGLIIGIMLGMIAVACTIDMVNTGYRSKMVKYKTGQWTVDNRGNSKFNYIDLRVKG